jgi:AcrR family transcriptional regulator
VPRTAPPDIDDRIIAACQAEIDKRGIIGMRVSAVAAAANTTVAMVYRRFIDRDGLLAHTLGAYYRKRISAIVNSIEERLKQPAPVTIDDVLNLTPDPHHPGAEDLHRNLPRIMVAAAENFALRVFVEQIIREGMERIDAALERLVDMMSPEDQFDPRIFSYLIINVTWMYNDLRGDEAISNEQYKSFLRKLLEDSKRPDQ